MDETTQLTFLPEPDIEELLPDIQECVQRHHAGRLEAITAAIEGGRLLKLAKARLNHGDWIPYLDKCGVNRRTATNWIRLCEMGLAPQAVVDLGGMKAALALGPPPEPDSALVAQELYDSAYAETGEMFARDLELKKIRREATDAGAVAKPSLRFGKRDKSR